MTRHASILGTLATLLAGSAALAQTHGGDHAAHGTAARAAIAVVAPSRAATTQPSLNNVHGVVTFTQVGEQVTIVAHIVGLTPGSSHGFHIHEKPDMSGADLMSTGGHYNPEGHLHGGPTTSPVHAGDFGNLVADASGVARLTLTVDTISLGGERNNVLGLPVIIHAKADDLASQPTGNAGGRIAGGLIEAVK